MAVISDGLWTRRFARQPRVIGRALPVHLKTGGPVESLTIIGVMPDGFDFPRGTEVWLPAAPLVRLHAQEWTGGDTEAAVKWLRVFYGIGTLRPGVTPDMAARELSGVIRTTDTRGGPEPPTDAVVTPVRSYLLGPAEPVLWTLLGGAALMLLVACANVAGLQLVGVRSHDPVALLTVRRGRIRCRTDGVLVAVAARSLRRSCGGPTRGVGVHPRPNPFGNYQVHKPTP